jgi:hypothetical protein
LRAAKNNFAEAAVYAAVIAVLLGWWLLQRATQRQRTWG